MSRLLFSLGLGCLCLSPFLLHAQLPPLENSTASLEASPAFAEPGETVNLTIDAYSLDTNGVTITWLIDNEVLTSATNERSIEVIAGELGETTLIQANLRLANGNVVPLQYELTPSRVDIIVEAETLTPTFYRGRPLPSVGSTIRVITIPNLGETRSPDEFSYLWRLNNKVLYGGSVKGKYIAEFAAPRSRESIISVEVLGDSGKVVTRESLIIPHVEPELQFYTDNPLRGVSRQAITGPYQLIGSEIDVRAEPYYMSSDIFDQDPLIEWTVNNQVTDNPSDDPQVITLQNAGGSGRFSIGFHIRNLEQLLQGIEDDFILRF